MIKKSFRSPTDRSEVGMTLAETLVAISILCIATVGIVGMAFVATTTTENQGNLGARTAEYAQDKLEQLIALSFGDGTTNTAAASFVASSTGGTGLGGSLGASSTVGSSDPSAPVNGYVDYLDSYGNPLGGGTTAPS